MRILPALTLLLCITASACCAADIAVIPKPMKAVIGQGAFTLDSQTIISTDGSAAADKVGAYLSDLVSGPTGFRIRVQHGVQAGRRIVLTTQDADRALGAEGYHLSVTPDKVIIRASGRAGLFYGVQTVRQLLPACVENTEKSTGVVWAIPCVTITDQPRFRWRGLLLDTSRTFLSVNYLKRYIDLLALYKMNVLQLHLTDDQGWRVQIRRYPRLTGIASKFDERYNQTGGYYSQQEIRDLVAYAADRNITIVPEIEMPGHSGAALAAYPAIGCKGEPPPIFPFMEKPGLQPAVFCPGSEETFRVLEGVLSEVVDLFPSSYIHIGGDEAVKDWWKACPKCQARIKAEGLKDEAELQSYFIKRIESFLTGKRRKLVGWDEILEGGLAPRATVMSWRGMEGGLAAIRQGHDVVFSPTSHCYFDYPNEDFDTLNTYSFEPVPEGITAEQSKHILGAQGNMWTHLARCEDAIDRQVFPRLIALSEVTWSPRETRDKDDFLSRLQSHLARLDVLGVKGGPVTKAAAEAAGHANLKSGD